MSEEPQPLPRVLKQPAGWSRADLEARSFPETRRRIPAPEVAAPGGSPALTPPPPTVIRKGQARVEAQRAALALPVFEPEFPFAEPPDEAPPPVPAEPPPPTLEELRAAWQAERDEAVAQARREGFEAGIAAATAELEGQVAEMRDAFARDLAALQDATAEFFKRTEPLLATLAFSVVDTVLAAPLPEALRTVSERALTEAVERAAGDAPVDVLLHPVDYLRLQEAGVVDQVASLHAGLRWHPNADLKQGDWVVQSPLVTTRRLEAELVAALREQLGLGRDA